MIGFDCENVRLAPREVFEVINGAAPAYVVTLTSSKMYAPAKTSGHFKWDERLAKACRDSGRIQAVVEVDSWLCDTALDPKAERRNRLSFSLAAISAASSAIFWLLNGTALPPVTAPWLPTVPLVFAAVKPTPVVARR